MKECFPESTKYFIIAGWWYKRRLNDSLRYVSLDKPFNNLKIVSNEDREKYVRILIQN